MSSSAAELAAVAAAQTVPVDGDVRANVDAHLELAEAAADLGVYVVVFPELSLTGYLVERAPELALSLDDPKLRPLRRFARRRRLTLVVGAPVSVDGRLRLAAIALGPEGGDALYAKQHLGAFSAAAAVDGVVPPPEASSFAPGTSDLLLDVAGGPAACAICADTGRPEHAARAAARGARLYLASLFVIPSEHRSEAPRLERAAVRHGLTVVAANYGGPSGGLRAAGRSAVVAAEAPGGAVERVELPAEGRGLAVAVREGARWRMEARRL